MIYKGRFINFFVLHILINLLFYTTFSSNFIKGIIMFNFKSILFSAVITGISVSNLHSTLSYSAYIMGELRKEDQSYKASLRTHNIAHQKFPKIHPLNIQGKKQCKEKAPEQKEYIMPFEEYAANFFANYLQNWLNLFDHVPTNTTDLYSFSAKVSDILCKTIQVPAKHTSSSKNSVYERNLQFRINIAHDIVSDYGKELKKILSNYDPGVDIRLETAKLVVIFIKLFLTEYCLYSPPVDIISLIKI